MTGNDMEIAVEPRIAVVGVGGAGCNVVSDFYDDACCAVDTIAINTDKEGLHRTSADMKIYICKEVLKGEGAHGDAALGKKCADIHKEEIRQALAGHDAVFVIAGLGGGTGTGAAAVVLDVANSLGIPTFAVAISPFSFEGRRKEVAREGYRHIRAVCEHSILVDNDLVLARMSDLTMERAFSEVNRSIKRHVSDCVSIIDRTFRDSITRQREPVMADDSADSCGYPIQLLMNA